MRQSSRITRPSDQVSSHGWVPWQAALFVIVWVLLLSQPVAGVDRRCPGGCVAQVSFNGGPPMEISFSVELQIGDFEPLSPTTLRAPVRFNNLTNTELGITMMIVDSPPSYFYLESQSPTGQPFFPATSHGDYFFVLEMPSAGLTLRNHEPMVVEAQGLPRFPPPPPFNYTLRELTEFTDAAGNVVVVHQGTVTIVSDLPFAGCATPETTPPLCFLSANNPGPPASIEVTTQDTGSGLAHIEVLESTNANTQVPFFNAGTHNSQIVTAVKSDPLQASRVRLQVSDLCGNVTSCDPVLTTVLRSNGKPVTDSYTGLPQEEGFVTVSNGRPGLRNLDIEVNGRKFKVHGLVDGEERTLDVSSAMRPGSGNTIRFTAHGKPGSSAALMIWDGNTGP